MARAVSQPDSRRTQLEAFPRALTVLIGSFPASVTVSGTVTGTVTGPPAGLRAGLGSGLSLRLLRLSAALPLMSRTVQLHHDRTTITVTILTVVPLFYPRV